MGLRFRGLGFMGLGFMGSGFRVHGFRVWVALNLKSRNPQIGAYGLSG